MGKSKATPENLNSAEPKLPELKPMSMADMKAKLKEQKEGKLIELPISGLVVRVGKPTISSLLRKDVFPQELISKAIAMDAQKLEVTTRKDFLQSIDVMDTVAIHACISPKLVKTQEEVNDDSIYIYDLDDADRFAIYAYAQTGVEPLRKLRDEQGSDDAGSTMSKVPESAA